MPRISSSNLEEAFKQLNLAWQNTKTDWNDSRSQLFEQLYLEKLPSISLQARRFIEELDAILSKARKDCE